MSLQAVSLEELPVLIHFDTTGVIILHQQVVFEPEVYVSLLVGVVDVAAQIANPLYFMLEHVVSH